MKKELEKLWINISKLENDIQELIWKTEKEEENITMEELGFKKGTGDFFDICVLGPVPINIVIKNQTPIKNVIVYACRQSFDQGVNHGFELLKRKIEDKIKQL